MIFEYNKNNFTSTKSKNFFTKSAINDIYLTNLKSFLYNYINDNIRDNSLLNIIKKNVLN
jgi:hypothetical protein